MAAKLKFTTQKGVAGRNSTIFGHWRETMYSQEWSEPLSGRRPIRIIALSSRVLTVLPAIEFLAAQLRPVLRMQYVVDHLRQLHGDKGLLNVCPAVV